MKTLILAIVCIALGLSACNAPTSTNANVVAIENPNNQAKVVTGVISVAANRFLAKNPTYAGELVAVADALVVTATGNPSTLSEGDIVATLAKTPLSSATQAEVASDVSLALTMFTTAFAVSFPGVPVNYGIFLDSVANGIYAATGKPTVAVPVIAWPPVAKTP